MNSREADVPPGIVFEAQDTRFEPEAAGVGKVLAPPDHPVDSVENRGGSLLNSVNAFLVFWGSYWNSAPFPSPTTTAVTAAARELVEGDYLSALGQYAQIGPGTFVRSLFVGSDPPFSPVAFKDEDVENVIRAALTSAGITLAGVPDPFVCVMMPPGTVSSSDPSAVGKHGKSDFNGIRFYWGWARNDGTLKSTNGIVDVFSHELAEACTRPEVDASGIIVHAAGGSEEVGDTCNNEYTIYNGVAVQAYWSQADKMCTIPIERLPLNRWTRALTCVGFTPDRRLEVFAIGQDGALWHTWQTAPANGWNDQLVSHGVPAGTALLPY